MSNKKYQNNSSKNIQKNNTLMYFVLRRTYKLITVKRNTFY